MIDRIALLLLHERERLCSRWLVRSSSFLRSSYAFFLLRLSCCAASDGLKVTPSLPAGAAQDERQQRNSEEDGGRGEATPEGAATR